MPNLLARRRVLSLSPGNRSHWWQSDLSGAARIADYKNARYMSKGSEVSVDAVSVEARNTPQFVTNVAGDFSVVAALELPMGTGVGLQMYKEATNLLAEAPIATEVVTVVNALEYTLSLVGAGTATLSGAGAGVVSDAAPVTFTASGTSLTVTLSGSPDYLWLELGGVSTPALEPGETRNAGDVTVVQGSTLGPNLYTGQTFSLPAGVIETASGLEYTASSDASRPRINAMLSDVLPGESVEVVIEIVDYAGGTVTPIIGGNGTGTSRSANGTFTENIVMGSAQPGRFSLVPAGFTGIVKLLSISAKKIMSTAFPGQTGTSQTARYDWDPEGRTGEDFVIASEFNPGGDEMRLHMIDGKVLYETFLTDVSQGFVEVDGKDDGLPHSAIVHRESGAGSISLSVDGSAVYGPNIFSGFAFLASEWSGNGAGSWSCDGTQAGNADANDNGLTTIGQLFEWIYTIEDATANLFVWRGHSTPVQRGNGTYNETVLSNSPFFIFRATAGNTATISNISVRAASTRSDITLPDGLNLIREGRDAVGNHINATLRLSAQANGDRFTEWAGV